MDLLIRGLNHAYDHISGQLLQRKMWYTTTQTTSHNCSPCKLLSFFGLPTSWCWRIAWLKVQCITQFTPRRGIPFFTKLACIQSPPTCLSINHRHFLSYLLHVSAKTFCICLSVRLAPEFAPLMCLFLLVGHHDLTFQWFTLPKTTSFCQPTQAWEKPHKRVCPVAADGRWRKGWGEVAFRGR